MEVETIFSEFGLEKTANGYGYMHSLSPIGEAFVEFASHELMYPMIDIGAAFGVATLPCLKKGASIIANDIAFEHLEELKRRTPEEHQNRLSLFQGRFPSQTNFKPEGSSAILISHVLTFLSQDEIIEGFNLVHKWLVPGGKLFIVNYTPYHKSLSKFIPEYERRKKEKAIFAGYLENKQRFMDDQDYNSEGFLSRNVPNELNLLDYETLFYLLNKNKFRIDYLDYLGGKAVGVPEVLCLNGKEWIGCIATKEVCHKRED